MQPLLINSRVRAIYILFIAGIMAFRTIVTILLLSIAISTGNGAILEPLVNLLLNTDKPVSDLHKSRVLNFTELSGLHGFTTEEHTVTTDDGYVITIFRMRRGDCDECTGRPVLLMQGLYQGPEAWLDAGPDAGLAYLLANECRDVWVGSQRGTVHARKHVNLDPDRDAEFWQFSVDEIGFYDIPATIDYILKCTETEKLNYVGFSQGVGTFVVMCSERPGYCDKVNMFIALAPATRLYKTKSVMFRAVFESFYALEETLSSAGVNEVFARGGFLQGPLAQMCESPAKAQALCGSAYGLIDSFHAGSVTNETVRLIASHFPAGTSAHNLARYGQGLLTENFQKFDYGKDKNVAMYGTEQPPVYNVSAVTAPCAIFYGLNDHIVDPVDVFWFRDRLPNLKEATPIAVPQWNHFDMIHSKDIKPVVFDKFFHYI
ncbi:lipase 1-like [Bicyclus anynana]|uniref:Lipase n=1 Tax=Bicyclus anynana TaxID=110368 RepID=A0A6J1N9T0_BICAN|nr:lipase 1-like [Bicyclus anynana]